MNFKLKAGIIALSVLTLFCSVFTISMAATCLDVRDYGYHRYQAYRYDPVETNYVCLGTDGNGNFVFEYDVVQRQVCVCGAERNQNLGTYRKTVSRK